MEELQGGEQAPIVIVYRREGGLTRGRPRADRGRRARSSTRRSQPRRPRPAGSRSRPEYGDAALLIGNVTGDGESQTILDPVDDIRERVSDPGGGLEVKVTGPAGFAADAIKVFETINGTLLLGAAAASSSCC